MKKFLLMIIALNCCAVTFCQNNCDTIYAVPYENEGIEGYICVCGDGGFYLFGRTDYMGERCFASIYLGKDNIQAIKTLKSLYSLTDSKLLREEYKGYNGAITAVWRYNYDTYGNLVFHTDGVKGDCYLLDDKFDYSVAIMAVGEYIPDFPK